MEKKTFPSSRKNSTEDALPQEVQPQFTTRGPAQPVLARSL